MSNQSKDRLAQIRITRDEDELIKRYGGNKSEIWRIGFKNWLEKIPQKLEEQAEYHRKMSLQCNDKLKEINLKERARRNILDECCLDYIKYERVVPDEITDLPREDRNWIEARVKNKKLKCDIAGFIERVRELINSDSNTTTSL